MEDARIPLPPRTCVDFDVPFERIMAEGRVIAETADDRLIEYRAQEIDIARYTCADCNYATNVAAVMAEHQAHQGKYHSFWQRARRWRSLNPWWRYCVYNLVFCLLGMALTNILFGGTNLYVSLMLTVGIPIEFSLLILIHIDLSYARKLNSQHNYAP